MTSASGSKDAYRCSCGVPQARLALGGNSPLVPPTVETQPAETSAEPPLLTESDASEFAAITQLSIETLVEPCRFTAADACGLSASTQACAPGFILTEAER